MIQKMQENPVRHGHVYTGTFHHESQRITPPFNGSLNFQPVPAGFNGFMNPCYCGVNEVWMLNQSEIVTALNEALAWELRAISMYAHYSAYVSGIHRSHLAAHFSNEVTESIAHAATVRAAIVKLDGEAITERDPTPIPHTSDYLEMLKEAYKTEENASKTYGRILPMIQEIGDSELYDALEVIYFDEVRSVEELRMMLK